MFDAKQVWELMEPGQRRALVERAVADVVSEIVRNEMRECIAEDARRAVSETVRRAVDSEMDRIRRQGGLSREVYVAMRKEIGDVVRKSMKGCEVSLAVRLVDGGREGGEEV